MEAFVRVVDAGSFSGAARRWGRSNAVVSKYVAALEDHLGVELLRRTTRSLSLTEAGRAYHDRCVALLSDIDALEASLRDDAVSPRGLLRVSAPPGFASKYLDAMTSTFIARYPDIQMDLDLTHRMVDLVEEGIDVAIRVTEPRDSSLIARRLGPAPIRAVASPAYLERAGTPSHPKDLRNHPCLVDTNFRDQQRWRFEVDGKPQTVAVSGPVRVNSPMAVTRLAIAGHGVALCPDFMVAEALASGHLVEVLPGSVAFRWAIHAVYPRRRYVSGRVRVFIDHLAAALGVAS